MLRTPLAVIWPRQGEDGRKPDWIDWMVAPFPPEVCRNFTPLSIDHDHGR